MLKYEDIEKILGIDESYKAPTRVMNLLFDREEREKIFKEFLEIESDISYEWFKYYFESEHAERKTKKQDFTPASISKLLSGIVGGNTYFECAAGTGGILIHKWNADRLKKTPFDYNPSDYFYQVEEVSDRALPFLLFNMLIRGMNGIVLHGDSLERNFKQIYFIQNSDNDALSFSDLNIMPHSEEVTEYFKVKKWLEDEIDYKESELFHL